MDKKQLIAITMDKIIKLKGDEKCEIGFGAYYSDFYEIEFKNNEYIVSKYETIHDWDYEEIFKTNNLNWLEEFIEKTIKYVPIEVKDNE